jgi:hypothetical protein
VDRDMGVLVCWWTGMWVCWCAGGLAIGDGLSGVVRGSGGIQVYPTNIENPPGKTLDVGTTGAKGA